MPDLSNLRPLRWEDVSADIIGRTLHVQYSSPDRYDIGVVSGVGADQSTVNIYLGYGAKVGVMRDKSFSRVPDPDLYLLPE